MSSNFIPFFSNMPSLSQTILKDTPSVSFETCLTEAMSDSKPGQIVEGTIVDLNKNSLTISLPDESIIHAILDGSIPLNIGDTASFQVSGFHDSALVLKLLSSSIPSSLDTTVEKALLEAGIPKNEETKELVLSLLHENLPIDKNTLKLLHHYVRMYPDTSPKDLALLMKLNLPITPASVSQMTLYQNQEHELTKELGNLKDSLLTIMTTAPQSEEAKALFEAFTKIMESSLKSADNMEDILNPTQPESFLSGLGLKEDDAPVSSMDVLNNIQQGELPKEGSTSSLSSALPRFSSAETPMFAADTSALLTDPSFVDIFSKLWKNHFSLSVDDLKKNGISSFYDRLEEDLHILRKTLQEKGGEHVKNADNQLTQLKDNIDFMKNLNSVMVFAQLPFQLKEKNIHSELFIYTKKKELKQNPDDISVLLHLDMDFLGPVDVHITMHRKNVQAKFYLTNDSCALVEKHLPAFSKHLQSKGYYLNYSIKEQETLHSVMDEIQKSCDQPMVIKGNRYTFDQRA